MKLFPIAPLIERLVPPADHSFRHIMFSKMTPTMIVLHGEIMERLLKIKNWFVGWFRPV